MRSTGNGSLNGYLLCGFTSITQEQANQTGRVPWRPEAGEEGEQVAQGFLGQDTGGRGVRVTAPVQPRVSPNAQCGLWVMVPRVQVYRREQMLGLGVLAMGRLGVWAQGVMWDFCSTRL